MRIIIFVLFTKAILYTDCVITYKNIAVIIKTNNIVVFSIQNTLMDIF